MGEAIIVAIAACGDKVFLAAASAAMCTIPRGRVGTAALAVEMTKLRGTCTIASPVVARHISASWKRGAV